MKISLYVWNSCGSTYDICYLFNGFDTFNTFNNTIVTKEKEGYTKYLGEFDKDVYEKYKKSSEELFKYKKVLEEQLKEIRGESY
tara:strand:- start:338 stop:589 length:252 start_codon:yes stop_codon:yes gene_type:complete